ncbi:hypothetical protein ACLKA6_001035 [Drosophila palustris]
MEHLSTFLLCLYHCQNDKAATCFQLHLQQLQHQKQQQQQQQKEKEEQRPFGKSTVQQLSQLEQQQQAQPPQLQLQQQRLSTQSLGNISSVNETTIFK